MKFWRGDLLLVNLNPVVGSEQGNVRPVVIVQNDILNRHSATIIVAPVTSRVFSREFPNQVFVEAGSFGFNRDSTILLDQIRVIDKRRILKKLGSLDSGFMRKVDLAIGVSLGLK